MLAVERTTHTGIRLGGMNISANRSIMHYIAIDYIFNIAACNLVLSLKCGNSLGLFIIGK